MVTIRQQRRRSQRQQHHRHHHHHHKQLTTVALLCGGANDEKWSTTVTLTVTHLTANKPIRNIQTTPRPINVCWPLLFTAIGNNLLTYLSWRGYQLHYSNMNKSKPFSMLAATVIIVIAFASTNASAQNVISSKAIRAQLESDTRQLIATILRGYNQQQQHQSAKSQRTPRQDQLQRQQQQDDQLPLIDGNIFTQLNSFIQARQKNASDIAGDVLFKYYNTDGDLVYQSNLEDPQNFHATKCNPKERFAILLHGWRESCNTTWMKQLVGKLGKYRGGCIMCMDYSKQATESYVRLVRIFEPIVQILTLQLFLLDYIGFDMNKGFMFGFSFGGQLAVESGRRLGNQRIKEIDTCDMAGPGFDHRSNQPNHREAAQNVQCIHTSRDKGTRYYNCHQDWRLGNCGVNQIASNSPPFGSHGLCPYMYVNAFEHDFYAIEKPTDCTSKRSAARWPEKFKMGYMETRKWQVSGELFAHTGKSYPFNIVPNSTENAITSREWQMEVEVQQPTTDTVFQRLRQRILKYVFLDRRVF